MAPFEAVVLGVLQGLTEFFPVSSSGHLVICQALFGLKEPQLAFDIFLHLGTLISVIVYFRRDIYWLFGKDKKTVLCILIASLPTFIIGFFFKEPVEHFVGMPKLSGAMILVTGAILIFTSLYSHFKR
ncbi:MAG: undecaprenyl-diphosphate phosphatase, partial [Candidatus Omnitrophica bacterium]|nr:undecaprenyl-diphosphate phosphatase [Candidatus Omnitrophota bacterium]